MKDPARAETIAKLLAQNAELSDREVARRVGAAPGTVGRVRQRLESEGIITPSETRLGADGRRHPATTARSYGRRAGELPEPGIRELLGDVVASVTGSQSRRQQRHIANYLKRLAGALADQGDLEGWDDAEAAAQACIATLGPQAAISLADLLGYYSGRVYRVAASLKKGVTSGQST